MTTNIFSVLNQGKTGLLTQQLAIEVTGNNIANVQTKGYTRQSVNLETNTPRQIGLGLIGTGVRVRNIARNFDQFLFNQVLGEQDPIGQFGVKKESFERVELLFNETTGRSINRELGGFFGAFHDLSTRPAGFPERTQLIAQAESMVSTFNSIGDALFKEQQNLDNVIVDEVSQVNSMLKEIVALNKTIHANEPGQTEANELRDRRDILVKDLSQKMDVTLVDEKNGQVRLTLSDGTPLVLGLTDFPLSTELNGDNMGFKDILISDGGSSTKNITSLLQGGKLRGLLDMRDREVATVKDQLDRLAAGIMREVNRVHQQGIALDGSTGNQFFAPLDPVVKHNTQNAGSAQVSLVNSSNTTSSVDKYKMRFTGTSSFDLINKTTGAASASFTFSSGVAFNIAGGMTATITGSGVVGDEVDFSISENAAALMRLSDDIKNDSIKIAAGENSSDDGNNSLKLANLQNSLVGEGNSFVQAGNGSFTFDDFYNGLVSRIGVQSRSAQSIVTQQEGVMLQLDNRRESISGVSIDEEMINLIKFQQAFAASARLINVVEEMFDIIQNRI